MTYTTEQKDEAAHLLCTYFPGTLHFGVARTWATAEAGANNNVFGVTISGKLQKYPTMAAGVKAAAIRIKTLIVYKNVRAAFTSPHVRVDVASELIHADRQASALCRSPWHSGVSGLKAQGGLDKYYARIFRAHGYTIVGP